MTDSCKLLWVILSILLVLASILGCGGPLLFMDGDETVDWLTEADRLEKAAGCPNNPVSCRGTVFPTPTKGVQK